MEWLCQFWETFAEGVFGPRKQPSQKPLLNLTSGKTKLNFRSHPVALGCCIYLGLITPCPKPPTPCSTTNAISTKEYPKRPAWLTFPLIASTNFPLNMKPPWSFSPSAWSLGRMSPLLAWGKAEVKASTCNVGDLGSIPGSGRSPGEGNGTPLQCSCLENPMDEGAWWAAVHGVAKSRTRLSDFTFTFTSIEVVSPFLPRPESYLTLAMSLCLAGLVTVQQWHESVLPWLRASVSWECPRPLSRPYCLGWIDRLGYHSSVAECW